MYNNTYNENFLGVRTLMTNNEFEKAYQLLRNIKEKCAEWYFLNGVSAMNIGYYQEGEESINKAISLEPKNTNYSKALEAFNFYRDNYRDRSHHYNRRRRHDIDGCCCCCCDDCCCVGDDCCENCMKLWCLDSCCECCGGDLIDCC
ncbi:hypothetical protein [Romboutsia sp.]|uniref:hypothetical protein n=1 Tax=Romboutsia sp. TaxID=1965302 RepID=UPI003F2A7FEA